MAAAATGDPLGEDVQARDFSREDRQRYREKVKRCLDALRHLLDEGMIETGQHRVGLELEIYLVDRQGTPMMLNDEILARIESDDWQTELAQFNIEFNLPPRDFGGSVLSEMEQELRKILNHALEEAQELDARMLIVGILPTLRDLHVTRENLSKNPRYHLLNDQILQMRGEDLRIEIEGSERLVTMANSITMEAASTSMQLHLQVDPDDFARYWNAAQAIAAAQLAVGANSPFFLGKKLWYETRIALFEQAIDTRTEELQAQGVRPRVWFGERWIDGFMDLFDENVRYFPSLLPVIEPEDPLQQLEQGEIPELKEMSLHNGTIYRWNRPVYDVLQGTPHIRLENRVLPAGPSIVDEIANAAFFYGLVRSVADGDPIHQQLSFSAATENFFAAAREGLGTPLYWPTIGPTPADELLLDHLLPRAHDGLDAWGLDPDDRDRYLGIIEDRARTGITGASWQVQVAEKLHDGGLDRESALLEMTRRYIENMNTNEPVHTWPID